MYNKDVSNPAQLPVQESKRWSTDVICTTISAVFAITIFVLACIFFNTNGLNAAYFSGSTQANICSPQLIYISGSGNSLALSCIKHCPSDYYDSNGVCWPRDQLLAAQYSQNANLSPLQEYRGFKWAILWTILFAFSISCIWSIFSLLFPRSAPIIAVILAAASLITIGLLLIFRQEGFFYQNRALRLLALIVLFGLAVIVALMGIMYRNSLRLQGVFLDYSRSFIAQNYHLFIYTPIFMLLAFGLLCLFIFQHCSFSSKLHSNSNFFDFSNPGLLGWINIIQFIWGLQFLRDSFNYCISVNTVDWYWLKKKNSWYFPFQRLLVKNWGSVAAGSFLNAFFELPTLLIELFTCHKDTCCNRVGDFCDSKCFCFDYMFNLVRTDTYTYINLSGIPYCNSARQCTKVCHFNNQFVGSYNPIKHYRFVVQVLIVSISSLFGYIFTGIRVNFISFWHIFSIIVITYAVGSWLVSVGIDAAQSVSTNFFVEYYECHEYQFMQKALPPFRRQVEHCSNKGAKDGNC